MKLNKANLAGLTSPGQQSEMKSILAGTWPPLKPLPVFKYETAEYRATIDFDKKRGEWVCRKTSLPSNEVQELRGGLREITLALPNCEEATFTEELTEQQEQDLERDAHRRLQAIREWREKYENGAHYSELCEYLSASQRTELDDSLRLSLTARQLQFNAKNVANVFDDLSIAGGRFAALIEFAKRNKAKEGNARPAGEEGVGTVEAAGHYSPVPQVERVAEEDKQSPEISSPESAGTLNSNDFIVRGQETAEPCTDVNDFPVLSIKNVFPEQEQTTLAERMAHTALRQFEIETFDAADEESSLETETSEIVDEDSAPLVERPHQEERHSHQEGRRSPVFSGFAPQLPTGHPFTDRFAGPSSRFPLRISAFQANVFALLFLFAVTSFTVGLTVGRGPLGKRLREAPKALLATDAKPPTLPGQADQTDQADESTPRTPPPPPASSDDSTGINRSGDAAPSKDKFKDISPGPENSAEARPTNSNSSPEPETKPFAEPEVGSAHTGAIAPVPQKASPPASSKLVRRPKVASKAVRSMRSAPRIPAPYRLASTIGAAPHVPRTSTILVTVPGQESQPFRVSFPNKTIAATSSLAMTAQLSVLVFPEPGPPVAHKSARLEAGELVSFGWPRYPRPSDRYGLAETIRIRATIGQLGRVQDVKFLGGSASLLPATMEAIRMWRYTPTLLDKRPVQAQQDITIEFRPPQYASQVLTRHPSHN